MAESIRVTRAILEQMLSAARRQPEAECCGLLAGRDATITQAFPAVNILASPTRYEIAPAELFRIFRAMRDAGLDHLGIYHSHLTTDNAPSPRDIELSFYPDAAYFIISLREDAPRPIRAFRILDGAVTELEIEAV